MCIKFFKNYFLFFFVFRINIAIYIFSGIKTLNKFLYLSRYQNYYKQIKKNSCSLSEGSNCYFIEKNYSTYNNKINEKTNKTFDDCTIYWKNQIYMVLILCIIHY